MKKFLCLCGLYALLMALWVLGMEIATRHIPNSYRYKDLYMDGHSDSLELLVLGNSHAYMGIDPAGFDMHAFSLANVSQSYRYDLFLLQKYLDNMPELKYVVLPVSYFSLHMGLGDDEWWRNIYYHIYMDCDFYPDISKHSFEIGYLKGAAFRCFSYYVKNEDMAQCTGLGLSTAYQAGAKAADWDNGAERVGLHTVSDPENVQEKVYLEQIANLLNGRGIELILVTMPVRPSYREAVNPLQMEVIYRETAALQGDYSNIRYLDLFSFDGFDDDDWFDGDHLTPQGAEKMANMLQDSIRFRPVRDFH